MSQTAEMKRESTQEHRNLENVRQQILDYEHQIKEYLDHIDANVEYYKFSVEKHGDGITVEFSVRATVRPKTRATA